MRLLLGLLLLGLAAFLADRLGLWMERRGWIYWRRHRAKGTLASTMLTLQKVFESGKAAHVLEAKQDGRKEAPDPGGGDPGRYPGTMRIHDLTDLPAASLGAGTAIEKRMLAEAGAVPHVMQFVRATFAPGQVAPAHAHADWTELFYVESGEGTLTVDGASHALRPGVTFTVAPGERHEIASGPASDLVVVYVSIKH